MEEVDKIDWYKFINKKSNKVSRKEYLMICELHSKYYKHSYYEPCTCRPTTIKQWIAQINDIYEPNKKN